MPKHSRRQIERLKKARRAKTGRFVVTRSKPGTFSVVYKKAAGRAVSKDETHGPIIFRDRSDGEDSRQPRPKIPLLSGGMDPTLGERFEEELYRS